MLLSVVWLLGRVLCCLIVVVGESSGMPVYTSNLFCLFGILKVVVVHVVVSTINFTSSEWEFLYYINANILPRELVIVEYSRICSDDMILGFLF